MLLLLIDVVDIFRRVDRMDLRVTYQLIDPRSLIIVLGLVYIVIAEVILILVSH